MKWLQRQLNLLAKPRGFHLVTSEIVGALPELQEFRCGILNLFIQHTSASLTINENTDPDVRLDFEMVMNLIVPESLAYAHADEGADDMPAHVKASLLGPTHSIPITDGHLALGTWQGIYLCEHRDHASSRRLVATLFGEAL